MASTYLTKASYGTPTSTKIFTWSCWIKRSKLGDERIFDFYSAPFSFGNGLFFLSSDQLGLGSGDSGNGRIITNRVFRDTSAWYHIVAVQDTTNATASDRLKLYVNGVRETSFSTSVDAVLNAEYQAFRSDVGGIGTYYDKSTSSLFFDGSMAHVHFIDGTAYDADTFGETDSLTGIWKPKTAPSVTYGTNGFFLKFENSGAFGTDSSGNSNTFTVNGTMTQTIDTPSNVFCTLNSLDKGSNVTLSNGNTTATCSSTNDDQTKGTLGFSKGKWYWEIKYQEVNNSENAAYIGFERIGESSGKTVLLSQAGTLLRGTASGTAPSGFTDGDILGLAVDCDNLRWYIYKNGVANGDYVTFTNATNDYIIPFQGNNDFILHANFGNGYFGTTAVSSAQNPDDGIGIFEYDVPTGYRALCTKSINAEEYS